MRSPRTANDDHPGPIGCRHNSCGGDADQSVSMRTPRMIESRLGPRKPGQVAGGSRRGGATGLALASDPATGDGGAVDAGAAGAVAVVAGAAAGAVEAGADPTGAVTAGAGAA